MAQATTNEIRNIEPGADATRRTYEAPVVVDLGDAAELTRADAGGVAFDGAAYS